MTVKTSPSDNGDGRQHTEDDTFHRLRRSPLPDAYHECSNLMRHILSRDNLSMIDADHPEIVAWLTDNGWTSKEIVVAYGKWCHEWKKSRGISFE